MSYAVIKTGGKQYRVIEGQTLLIERLPDDVGATVALQPLLLAGDGDPVFEGDGLASAVVQAEVVAHERGPKLRDTKVEYAWGGFVDISMNRAPDFGRLADIAGGAGEGFENVYYLQGFSG